MAGDGMQGNVHAAAEQEAGAPDDAARKDGGDC